MGLRTFTSQFFSHENLRFNIRNLSYLPRWIIVLFDMSVLVLAFFGTYIIFQGTGLDYIITNRSFTFVSILFGVNVFFFWLFRTYSGIIRHSSYIDALKLLFSQIGVLITFVVLNFGHQIMFGTKIFLNTALFINMVLAFCGLFLYRVAVKQVFEYYFAEKSNINLTRMIIFGTDANAISVAKALKLEVPSRFKIVAFVDKNNQNASNRIKNLRQRT